MKKIRPSVKYLSIKRQHKTERRRFRSKSSGEPVDRYDQAFWRNSDHLRLLLYNAGTKPKAPVSTIKIPKVFSFIRDPERALEAIGDLIAAARSRYISRVHVDHSALDQYELAAEAVLDVVALDVLQRRVRAGNRLLLSGEFPQNHDSRRFVQAIGISEYLKITGTELPVVEHRKLVLFKQTKRTPKSNAKVAVRSEKAKVVQEFADHISKCLQKVGMELTVDDRASLCEYTGELIDNVEQHGHSESWYLSSFLDTSMSPPICEVSIYNFGRTFADTFLELAPEMYARQLVQPYVDLHESHSFFTKSWRIQDLLTVIALSGGISCKKVDDDDTRGQGTVDLIEFFESVSDSCSVAHNQAPEMAIVSGDTHIRFDGKYRMGPDSDGRRVIAFNAQNSLTRPPDGAYVRPLRNSFFPGTLVSIRFSLGTPNQMDKGDE